MPKGIDPAESDQDEWSVIFKLECFGRTYIRAHTRTDAALLFLKQSREDMLRETQVFRPRVMGVVKRKWDKDKKVVNPENIVEDYDTPLPWKKQKKKKKGE